MKKISVLLMALSCLFIMFSCGDDKDDNPAVTGIRLNKNTTSVAVESSETLQATLEPSGASGNITWNSSLPTVATVDNNGKVTGVAVGVTTITASCGAFDATCIVTVTPKGSGGETPPSLSGSNYYLLFLDETSFNSMSSSVIKEDLRTNEIDAVLDIWPAGDSYTAVDPSGPNFYGEVEGWIAMKSNQTPWEGTGAGGIQQYKSFDLSAIDGTYTFHCAYKSKDGGKNEIALVSVDGDQAWIELPAQTDGEWHEYEVPMSTFIAEGWSFPRPFVFDEQTGTGLYSMAFRSSPANTTLEIDAVFIYKK